MERIGVSESWHRDGSDAFVALAALRGQGRAHLLLERQQPLCTSECAELTSLSVSAASPHLSMLRESGLVDSRRSGVRVVHTLIPLGEALATGR